MVSGITPCARECKWIVYFGETPKAQLQAVYAAWEQETRLTPRS